MNVRYFRDKELKYVWAKVISMDENGWCKIIFSPKGKIVFNYHINYLNAFYVEKNSMEA